MLTLPAGVVRSAYNAAQLRPYDPADAIGDVSPVSPTPVARKTGNKCGAFGKILLVAVAVAVAAVATGGALALATGKTLSAGLATIGIGSGTAITGVTAGGFAAAGATGGAIGSIASQGAGLATGIQDKFSWKGVALAGIAGGVGGALGGAGILAGGKGFTAALNGAARGALGNAATQGIALATGLQGKFDWAGVAVGAAVGGAVGATRFSGFGGRLASGMAGALAGGAARSLIDGSSFGDNILAVLPDVIGTTVGNMVASWVAGSGSSPRLGYADVGADDEVTYRGGQTGAGDGAAVQPQPGKGGGQVGRSASSGSGPSSSPTANGAASNAVEDIVVTARRDTLDAIRYVDAEGRYDEVDHEAQTLGLDFPNENALFRLRALEHRIFAPFTSAYSFVFDNIPVVGTAKSAAQIYTGTDLVTHQPVNRWVEAGTLAVSVVPFGKLAGKGFAKLGTGMLTGSMLLNRGGSRLLAAEKATGAFRPGTQLEGGLGIFAERQLTVTPKGLDLVRGHLAQFGDVPINTAMLNRLEGAMASGQRVTGADAIFYTHEAAEATKMARGLSYSAAHGATLEKYGVSPYSVYHPDVIRAMPEHFNSNWNKFWGIK